MNPIIQALGFVTRFDFLKSWMINILLGLDYVIFFTLSLRLEIDCLNCICRTFDVQITLSPQTTEMQTWDWTVHKEHCNDQGCKLPMRSLNFETLNHYNICQCTNIFAFTSLLGCPYRQSLSRTCKLFLNNNFTPN